MNFRKKLWIVGKSVPRLDAIEKVTGTAIYGTDIKIPGMLYGKVLRSYLPHARILNIDTSRAAKLKGVKAVVTGRDLMATYGRIIQDQPYYCWDKVRYIGDPVAGVAAVDEDTAEEALELIKIDYEELPPVLDVIKAMESNFPLVHENIGNYWYNPLFPPIPGSNICYHFKIRKGNIEEGFKRSEIILDDTFTTPLVQHCHIEPHASVAQVDSSGRITIWTNTQTPYACLSDISRSLRISMNKIRIISSEVGGGFGGKTLLKVEPLCIVLAMKVKNNRPVKITLTREEEFYASVVRHASVVKVKTGVRKDGTLIARQVKVLLDTGAYADIGPSVARHAGIAAAGPYEVPYLYVDAYCVYTNKSIAGAFRGFGVPQIMWAIESQMDMLAEQLGINPVEFRIRNALEDGSISSTGQILKNVGIKECIRKAMEAVQRKEQGKSEGYGRGIALMHEITGTPSSSSCFVKLNEDGTADVQASTVDIGQGSKTVLAQIAAEELGLRVEEVRVVAPDTDLTPFDYGTFSSRSVFHMGNAVKLASEDARKQLLEAAGKLLEATPSDLEVHDGLIWVKGDHERRISVKEVPMAAGYLVKGKPIIGRGTFTINDATPLDPETGQGENPIVFWMYGAQVVEVQVDSETGSIKVLRVIAAHDVGKAINPVSCQQQIEGAIGMGVGVALMEEIKTERGKILNPNFVDYKIPTALDMPEMIPILVETYHEQGPYGAKGVGEPALIPTAPAIANAVYDAVGVRIKDLPITPEKVWKALKEKR